jgi:hypothetical protein
MSQGLKDDNFGFILPSIKMGNKGSPFRGFKDLSIVTQKLRKDMHSQDGVAAMGRASFEFGSEQRQRRKDNVLVGGDLTVAQSTRNQNKTRFASKDR